MRRKPGTLLPLEVAILATAIDMHSRGAAEFHGFWLAKELKGREEAPLLTAYGTLYRALDRMAKAGLLSRRWEDPEVAEQEGRPRRRLYGITAVGEASLAAARAGEPVGAFDAKPGLAAP